MVPTEAVVDEFPVNAPSRAALTVEGTCSGVPKTPWPGSSYPASHPSDTTSKRQRDQVQNRPGARGMQPVLLQRAGSSMLKHFRGWRKRYEYREGRLRSHLRATVFSTWKPQESSKCRKDICNRFLPTKEGFLVGKRILSALWIEHRTCGRRGTLVKS